jgi:hypothetical protein
MLRGLALLLVLANLAFFAWTRGWLDPITGSPQSQSEPGRLAQQVRPETIVLLDPTAAAAAAQSASEPAVSVMRCIEAGPFIPAEAALAEAALAADAAASAIAARGTRVPLDPRSQWIVSLGNPASRDVQAQKEAELKRLGVPFEELIVASAASDVEQVRLVLGRFDSMADADLALAALTTRGVRSARVIELPPPPDAVRLRFDGLASDEASVMLGLAPTVVGKPFAECVGR